MAYTRYEADKGIMDALAGLKKKAGAGGRGETTAGEPAPATSLWGMLYADDAGVVSKSPEQLRKMIEFDRDRVRGVRSHRFGGQD